MKSLKEYLENDSPSFIIPISEEKSVEAKDLFKLRKGTTIYIVHEDSKEGIDNKIASAKVIKSKPYQGLAIDGVELTLSDNKFGIDTVGFDKYDTWRHHQYGEAKDKYGDKPLIVGQCGHNFKSYYFSTSKDALIKYFNMRGSERLSDLNDKIIKLEQQLQPLLKEKAKAENEINLKLLEEI